MLTSINTTVQLSLLSFLVKSKFCQVLAGIQQWSYAVRLNRKCLVEAGSPSDSCAEECRKRLVLYSVGLKGRAVYFTLWVWKGGLWTDLLSEKITKQAGKWLRKLFSESFPLYSLMLCLLSINGLLKKLYPLSPTFSKISYDVFKRQYSSLLSTFNIQQIYVRELYYIIFSNLFFICLVLVQSL